MAVTAASQTAVPLLMGSSSMFLSSGWTTKADGDISYAPINTMASGTCSRQIVTPPAKEKVGDYVGAETNPNDLSSFWLAGERSVVTNGSCVWTTQIVQVTP
jgi:hypothetical protein